MALDTFSKFYYGHTVERDNRFLNISEGGPEISVELAVGSYTLSEFVSQVQTGLNSSNGANTYAVSVDRVSRLITISADGPFELLVSSGSQLGQSAFGLVGFTGADRTGSSSYIGDSPSGFEYKPQFKLQDYVDSSIFEQGISTVINKNSEGDVEIVSFGRESFFEMDIKYITNKVQDNQVILNNPNGLADAIAFMQDITKKRRFEFMKDANNPDEFSKVICEKTELSNNGVGFRLKERLSDSLRDYYDTGLLTLRVVN